MLIVACHSSGWSQDDCRLEPRVVVVGPTMTPPPLGPGPRLATWPLAEPPSPVSAAGGGGPPRDCRFLALPVGRRPTWQYVRQIVSSPTATPSRPSLDELSWGRSGAPRTRCLGGRPWSEKLCFRPGWLARSVVRPRHPCYARPEPSRGSTIQAWSSCSTWSPTTLGSSSSPNSSRPPPWRNWSWPRGRCRRGEWPRSALRSRVCWRRRMRPGSSTATSSRPT